ncbi:MAG TPA: GAF domain-containing protein [Streptosporangiaceae bacterium]|nr:GAF domain-containing protein [Streptosporangiaceae bacterium]
MTIRTSPADVWKLPADAQAVLQEGLEDALSLLRADRGNVQIVDPLSGSLRIAAQAGFSDEFLEYFAVVTDEDGSACGIAARKHAQTVIADVNTDARYAPHRDIAAASGYRAVQSTPLLDLRGHLVGMLSTHYPSPYRPPDADLELMKRFGKLIGQAVEACLEADSRAAWSQHTTSSPVPMALRTGFPAAY